MDKKYITLFKEIARTTSVLAEQVMEYNKKNNDESGDAAAELMRDDFSKLYDRMVDENFAAKDLTIDDYRKLLVATLIVTNNINNKIIEQQKAIQNYNLTIIPRLQRIVDECKTQEEVNKLSSELFILDT